MTLKFGLAPMDGVTDVATRMWFQMIGGMDFTWTPFLRVTDTFPHKRPDDFIPEWFSLKGLYRSPTYLQVMGSRPGDIVRAAEIFDDAAPFIDLNCGCPSPTVVGHRSGSSLLETADYFHEFVTKVSNAVGPQRLSLKMRTGFYEQQNLAELIEGIKHLPLLHLTIHGRTRPQRYLGRADWSLIAEAAKVVRYPLIGSGDIVSTDQRLSSLSPVHSVIVGRGALRNPWLFCQGINSKIQEHAIAPCLHALVAFILMQDCWFANPQLLIQWAAQHPHYFEGALLSDRWWAAILDLEKLNGRTPSSVTDISVSPRALSRGKMIWNYLRSSLPEAFMAPHLMRASTLRELVTGLQSVAISARVDKDYWPLQYNSNHDWMYSGGGRP